VSVSKSQISAQLSLLFFIGCIGGDDQLLLGVSRLELLISRSPERSSEDGRDVVDKGGFVDWSLEQSGEGESPFTSNAQLSVLVFAVISAHCVLSAASMLEGCFALQEDTLDARARPKFLATEVLPDGEACAVPGGEAAA
jgi:hypothetical protein